MSEYLGAVAPFYVSRYRLGLLADRIAAGWQGKLAVKLTVPGAGEVSFDYQARDRGTIMRLARVLDWLAKTGAIGDAWDWNCPYTWFHLRSHIARVENTTTGVDHLVMADLDSRTPANWCTFLAGVRTNLLSLDPPDRYPALGSSPLALQAVLSELTDDNTVARHTAADRHKTCERVRNACVAVASEAPNWEIVGVAEVLHRCGGHSVLLGAPLFLSSFA